MNTHFAAWRKKTAKSLRGLKAGCHPKQIIPGLSEGLLAHYTGRPLIDAYDVYQHLMDYWAETMQDDCYLIAADGWKAETYRVMGKNSKGKDVDRGWACDLVPKPLIVARYFASEQDAIDELAAELETVSAKLDALEEEHGGDEGAFAELEKVNRAQVSARLKEIKDDPEAQDEADVLREWLKLSAEEADVRKRLKEAEEELDEKAYAKYPMLTESEVQDLVVDDKWMATLDARVHGELDRVSQQLTERVKELAERYGTPLPELNNRVAQLAAQVHRHLERMGFSWK
jgi:type I restriction enzyme M protein